MLPKTPLSKKLLIPTTTTSTTTTKQQPIIQVEIDLFLDFTCPYSKKMYTTVKTLPSIPETIQFNVRPVPQPWHAQATWLIECGLVAHMIGGDESFNSFATMMFNNQDSFNDTVCENLSRNVCEKLVIETMVKNNVIPSSEENRDL
jgi:hypothetical protein